MGFNVTEWEQVIDTVSDSVLQLIFKKVPLVGIWWITEYPQVLLAQGAQSAALWWPAGRVRGGPGGSRRRGMDV